MEVETKPSNDHLFYCPSCGDEIKGEFDGIDVGRGEIRASVYCWNCNTAYSMVYRLYSVERSD